MDQCSLLNLNIQNLLPNPQSTIGIALNFILVLLSVSFNLIITDLALSLILALGKFILCLQECHDLRHFLQDELKWRQLLVLSFWLIFQAALQVNLHENLKVSLVSVLWIFHILFQIHSISPLSYTHFSLIFFITLSSQSISIQAFSIWEQRTEYLSNQVYAKQSVWWINQQHLPTQV